MRVAVTYENGQIFQHFGHTEIMKIYEVENGNITNTALLSTNGQGHGALAGFLVQNFVDVLICGGIGGGAVNALSNAGIVLISGAQGDADAAVKSYLDGTLISAGTTCGNHGEGHSCGQHKCH